MLDEIFWMILINSFLRLIVKESAIKAKLSIAKKSEHARKNIQPKIKRKLRNINSLNFQNLSSTIFARHDNSDFVINI